MKNHRNVPLAMNSLGEYHYTFTWSTGGFNDIWAKDLEDFNQKFTQRFPNSLNELPNLQTLQPATESESETYYRMSAMWD